MAYVLVIEDDRSFGSIFEKALQHYGHKVCFANSLAEGSRLLRRVDPDAITIDWQIGGVTAEGFLDNVSTIPSSMRPPVMVLTNKTNIPDSELIHRIVRKPFSVGKLMDEISQLIRSSTKQPYEEIRHEVIDNHTLYLKWSGRITSELIRKNMHPNLHQANTVIFDISDLSSDRFNLEGMGRPKHPLIPRLERILFVVPPDLIELSQYLMAFIHEPIQVDYFDRLEDARSALDQGR